MQIRKVQRVEDRHGSSCSSSTSTGAMQVGSDVEEDRFDDIGTEVTEFDDEDCELTIVDQEKIDRDIQEEVADFEVREEKMRSAFCNSMN